MISRAWDGEATNDRTGPGAADQSRLLDAVQQAQSERVDGRPHVTI